MNVFYDLSKKLLKYPKLFKALIIALVVFSIGIPIIEPFKFIIALVSISMIFIGSLSKMSDKRLPPALFLLVTTIIMIALLALPQVKIEEGHNAYLIPEEVEHSGFQDLPPIVRKALKEEFLKLYPKDKWTLPDKLRSWRTAHLAEGTWTFSLDGVWPTPKYSRIVNKIDFESALEFRGGYINNTHSKQLGVLDFRKYPYNPSRHNLPFFVMYEISPSMVGGELAYEGGVFVEAANEIKKLEHLGVIKIGQDMINGRIYASSMPYLKMHFSPSSFYQFFEFVEVFLLIVLVIIIFFSFTYNRSNEAFIFIPLVAFVFFIDFFFYKFSAFHLIYDSVMRYAGDGLVHKGYGRVMLLALKNFDVVEALKGGEGLFYYMPGFRYIKMIEGIFFGETDLGRMVTWIFFLLSIFKFFRLFFSKDMTIFLFLLVSCSFPGLKFFHFDMQLYLHLVEKGYAEPLAFSLLTFGTLFLIDFFKSKELKKGIIANALYAAAILLRPNLAIAAGLPLLYSAWLLCSKGEFKSFVIISLGFLLFFLLPLHNYVYGNAYVLLTTSVGVNSKLGVGAYFQMLQGDVNAFHDVWTHLGKWAINFIRPLILIFTLVFCFIKKHPAVNHGISRDFLFRVWGLVLIGMQIPLLIFHPGGRYSSFAWFVTFTLFIASLLSLKLNGIKRYRRSNIAS